MTEQTPAVTVGHPPPALLTTVTPLLRVLLLVLTASVGNYLFPTLAADGNGQNQQQSRSELGLPDCQGLPGTSESPAVQRTFGDASARHGTLPQKQTDGLASGAAARLDTRPGRLR